MTNITSSILMKTFLQKLTQWMFLIIFDSNQAPPEEEQLILRAGKDPQAFDDLYRRYVDRVYLYHIVRTDSQEEAEDLTSQTFLAALEGISRFRGEGSFAAWLFGIARRKLVDHYRQPKTIPLDPEESTTANLEEEIDQRLTLQQIKIALIKIPPDRVEALCLRFFGQLSTAETGRMLSKSEGAVRNLIYRALQDLRRCLPVSINLEEE
jgi:RNA polymerase sigma-70 factor (ECF subfamily)